ncbi:hypothetical protein [Nodosilinea sp. FACHB-13]|uniref:hypothetical protein n=1 Tax=Cyanophyceae TaxID=3028117 RepID=UPI001689C8B7|nr:hypothetical protein [Nodosilinea sp. FACHB-13]MBD2109303.1 hypothetical protein [Nodosilinea sp. FACHB-13]
MERLLTMVVASIVVGSLAYTNPRTLGPYVETVVNHGARNLCEQPGDLGCEVACEAVAPVTKGLMQGALYLYSEKPQDLGVLTLYRTQLPGLEIQGVGLGGEVLVWSPGALPVNLCEVVSSPDFLKKGTYPVGF